MVKRKEGGGRWVEGGGGAVGGMSNRSGGGWWWGSVSQLLCGGCVCFGATLTGGCRRTTWRSQRPPPIGRLLPDQQRNYFHAFVIATAIGSQSLAHIVICFGSGLRVAYTGIISHDVHRSSLDASYFQKCYTD